MSGEVLSNNWYAVFVLTGEEDRVKERLEYRFREKFDFLVPKRELRERKNGIWFHKVRTLFPGYVLLRGNITIQDYKNFKNVPGLLRLLRVGYEPAKLESYEAEVLDRLIYEDEMIGLSDVLIENGRVVVVDGPLTSLEGSIISIDRRKGRARVSLHFLGEERTVDLGVNILQPA